MPLKPEQAAAMRKGTREAAGAFVDDMDAFRDVLANPLPTPGQIRRLSGMVRRLLLDADLPAIAAPRTGKLILRTSDFQLFHRMNPPPDYFLGGQYRSGGLVLGPVVYVDYLLSNEEMSTVSRALNAEVDLSLDNFIAQRVFCLRGQWVSRKVTVKYIANIASGVHSAAPVEPDDLMLARLRRGIRCTQEGGIELNWERAFDDGSEFVFDPKAIDPLLLELMSTIRCLATSPNVQALEAYVREELTPTISK